MMEDEVDQNSYSSFTGGSLGFSNSKSPLGNKIFSASRPFLTETKVPFKNSTNDWNLPSLSDAKVQREQHF